MLDPLTARQFIDRGGFDTKEKLRQWVYETALMPRDEFWDYQIVKNYIEPRATAGEEPMASKWRAAPTSWCTSGSRRRFSSSSSAARPTLTGA